MNEDKMDGDRELVNIVEKVLEQDVPVFMPDTGVFEYFGPGSHLLAEPYVYPMNDMDTEEHDDKLLLGDFLAWMGEKGYVVVSSDKYDVVPHAADKFIADYMKEERI